MAKYEKALSREFNEGGYTFLKRVLAQNIATQQPVIINAGESYFEYSYKPGDKTFLDGVKLIDGANDDHAVGAFSAVAQNYDVALGLRELAAEQPPMQQQETWLHKLRVKIF